MVFFCFLVAFVFADTSQVIPAIAPPVITPMDTATVDTAKVVAGSADSLSAGASSSSIAVSSSSAGSVAAKSGPGSSSELRHSVNSIEGLTVTPHNRSIQIVSNENVVVYLFDRQIDLVFTKKVPAGFNFISLENQRHGIYYAVIQVGEQMQVVKVVVI
jgi:hypothetical protein